MSPRIKTALLKQEYYKYHDPKFSRRFLKFIYSVHNPTPIQAAKARGLLHGKG
jgi:hypothetical protein